MKTDAEKNKLQEIVADLLDVSDFIANKGQGLGYDIEEECEAVKKLEEAAIHLSKKYKLIHSGRFNLVLKDGKYEFQ